MTKISIPSEFLAAIRASPDDPAPYLVLADYLDEHGDPDRAEFIRIHLAMEDDPAYEEAVAHFLRRYAYTRDWLPWKAYGAMYRVSGHSVIEGTFGDGDVDIAFEFQRGLVRRVICPEFAWRKYGDEALAGHPIRMVGLTDGSIEVEEEFGRRWPGVSFVAGVGP